MKITQEIDGMKSFSHSKKERESNFGALEHVNLTRKALKNIPLSDFCKEIIYGSILGDGSLKIHRNYKNARFKIRHSSIQKEYFFWKANQLAEISSLKSVITQKADGFSTHTKLLYQSRALPELTILYNKTHKKKIFVIKRSWLNHLSALSLAVWWFDDGSLISNKRKGVLCTDNFSKESVEILSQYLHVVWDVKTRVGGIDAKNRKLAKKSTYYRLWFSTESLKKFLKIIIPEIHKHAIPLNFATPKINIQYKNLELQERWISETNQRMI